MIDLIGAPLGGLAVGLVGRLLLGGGGAGSASSTSSGNDIVNAARAVIDDKTVAAHCWAWVWKVYQRAGFTGAKYPDLKNVQMVFRGKQYSAASPEMFLPFSRYDEIQPGDWLYVHNANKWDAKGNHSDIFIDWIDRSKGLARTASTRFAGKPGEWRQRNLNQMRIAFLMRPTV